MKVDKYTKIILTVIAVNLTIITVKQLDIIPNAWASAPIENNSTNYGLVPLNDDGSITVKLSGSDEIDVNITDISTYDKLNVNIQDINTTNELNVHLKSSDSYSLRYAGPIAVKTN